MTGSSPWQQLATMDTNSTGFESNFIAGFVRDSYGNVNVASYPTIQMYTSVSYPQPSWDATPAEAGNSAIIRKLDPDAHGVEAGRRPQFPLIGTSMEVVHEVTTGWISPNGGFQSQEFLAIFIRSTARSDGAFLRL